MSVMIINGTAYNVDVDGRSHEIEVYRREDGYDVDRIGTTEISTDLEPGTAEFVKAKRDAVAELL